MLDCSNGHYYSAPLLISVPLVGNFVITFHHDWGKLLIFWLWPWPCNLAQWRRRSNSVPILSLGFKIPSMLVVDFLCFCDSQRRTSLAVCYSKRKQRQVSRANPQIDGELTWDELNSMDAWEILVGCCMLLSFQVICFAAKGSSLHVMCPKEKSTARSGWK